MTVLFDLDGTILGTSEKKITILNRCAKDVGAPAITRETYYAVFNRLIQRGKLDTRKLVFETLLKDKKLAEKLSKQYQHRSLEKTFVYPDARDVLQALPGKKGLVTNGPRLSQRMKIEAFGLSQYFDVIVISGEVGVAKPNPQIFHLALRSLDARAAESFYVGDVEQLDVLGAKNAGLTSILIRRNGAPPTVQPDYEIQDLRELYTLVHE
jgi:HAD superfamily hydrolase (TIGR01549 family)